MPPPVHPPDDVAQHLAGRVEAGGVWVVEQDGAVVAFMDLAAGWLDSLYVTPARAGEGIGGALLDLAKTLMPAGFGLWVFTSNHAARRFYRRHGLVEVEHTDGSGNEERAPDIRMAWPGPHGR
jgi:GNAT superfamily N-acetyltransferase